MQIEFSPSDILAAKKADDRGRVTLGSEHAGKRSQWPSSKSKTRTTCGPTNTLTDPHPPHTLLIQSKFFAGPNPIPVSYGSVARRILPNHCSGNTVLSPNTSSI